MLYCMIYYMKYCIEAEIMKNLAHIVTWPEKKKSLQTSEQHQLFSSLYPSLLLTLLITALPSLRCSS